MIIFRNLYSKDLGGCLLHVHIYFTSCVKIDEFISFLTYYSSLILIVYTFFCFSFLYNYIYSEEINLLT
jgi:hypothetical protein